MKDMYIQRNKIEFGDRVFARLTMGGKTVVEFMINRVADMTELLGELRHMTYGMRGLAMLYIRNHSKGWSQERPLMLYSRDVPQEGRLAVAPSPTTTVGGHGRMAFPWEVH